MATLSGAEALGWADETGSLDAGKSADFAVVALPNRDAADPHELAFRIRFAGRRHLVPRPGEFASKRAFNRRRHDARRNAYVRIEMQFFWTSVVSRPRCASVVKCNL